MAGTDAVRDLADAELLDALTEARQEMFNLRFQHATGQLDNHARLKQVQRQIARVLTEVRAREIAAAEALAADQEAS